MKKDILFLCQFFYPEYNSSATLPFDTAEYLANNGFSVDAMCGYPKEYTQEKEVPLRECVHGINIHRLHYIQSSRGGKIGRLINYLSFTASVLSHTAIFRHYKMVIVYSNPPVLPIAPILANAIFGTKFIFVAYDIYPEVAYASHSLIPGGTIDKMMKSINKRLYKRASKIVVLTEEMKQFVLQHRSELDEARVIVIPNWAHEGISPVSKEIYHNFGYAEGDFIVSYFGNLGICQDVETLLNAIKLLKNDEQIHFLIAGHGSKLPQFREATKGFSNVKIMDYLLGEEFEQALAISSCGIVSLEKGLKGTCAPSKYYSYLQSGCPVIAITEEGSYLASDVEENGIGCSVRIGDSKELKKIIQNLCFDKSKRMSMAQNAFSVYADKYEKTIAMNSYREIAMSILD